MERSIEQTNDQSIERLNDGYDRWNKLTISRSNDRTMDILMMDGWTDQWNNQPMDWWNNQSISETNDRYGTNEQLMER